MTADFTPLVLWFAAVLEGLEAEPSTAPFLQLQGQPYFGGAMSVHVSAPAPEEWVLMAFGRDRLLDPLLTQHGPLYIGGSLAVVSLGRMPPTGSLQVPFRMPESFPVAHGVAVVLQAFVGGQLSNPATLPLDAPYFVPAEAQVLGSPHPQSQAYFGDRVAAGDLNGDGAVDLAVGAWFEDDPGVIVAGHAYVLWGPDFATALMLGAPQPKALGLFGGCVAVADLDGDDIDDLVVSDSSGLSPSARGNLHVYRGGPDFSAVPSFSVTSPGVGNEALDHARFHALGDLDGDGLPELAVGVANAAAGAGQVGRIDVYWSPNLETHTAIANPFPAAFDNFGSALAIGDVDGDGQPDLVEGSGRDDVGGLQNVGSLHVFRGGTLELLATIDYPLPAVADARFGDEVHVADLDGDGVAEILAADQLEHVFVFRTSGASLAAEVSVISKPPSEGDSFGQFAMHLATADVNGDGRVDILASDVFDGLWTDPLTPPPGAAIRSGVVRIALAPYFATFHNVFDRQPHNEDFFSLHFVAKDLDDDGRPELVVGASFADDGGVDGSGHVTILSAPAPAPP